MVKQSQHDICFNFVFLFPYFCFTRYSSVPHFEFNVVRKPHSHYAPTHTCTNTPSFRAGERQRQEGERDEDRAAIAKTARMCRAFSRQCQCARRGDCAAFVAVARRVCKFFSLGFAYGFALLAFGLWRPSSISISPNCFHTHFRAK